MCPNAQRHQTKINNHASVHISEQYLSLVCNCLICIHNTGLQYCKILKSSQQQKHKTFRVHVAIRKTVQCDAVNVVTRTVFPVMLRPGLPRTLLVSTWSGFSVLVSLTFEFDSNSAHEKQQKQQKHAEIKIKMFNRSMLRFALPGPFDFVRLCLFVLMLCFPGISTSHCSSLAHEAQCQPSLEIQRNYRALNLSNPSDGCCKLSFQNELESMSASHEKSPTELTLRQHPSSRSSSTFSFCVWVPVCATLACWQVSNETRSVLGQSKMVPVRWTKYPAVPTGLAVGTNPPGLPSGDHRWEV